MTQYSSPLRYPGGKQKLAPFILELIKRNNMEGCHYAEPYSGGAGVAIELLMHGYISHAHLNDKSFPIHAFWRSVLYKTEEFCKLVSDTPVTITEWRKQRQILNQPWSHSSLEVGFSLFYQNRANHSGIPTGGPIGGYNQRGKWKLDARFYKRELIRRIMAIAEKRAYITLRNWDAERFMLEHVRHLGPKPLTYCDPPYFNKAQRLYLNTYQPSDHARIARVLQDSLGQPWVLSYDSCPEIVGLYPERVSFEYFLPYTAAGVRQGREIVVISDQLRLPKTSSIRYINDGLCAAA